VAFLPDDATPLWRFCQMMPPHCGISASLVSVKVSVFVGDAVGPHVLACALPVKERTFPSLGFNKVKMGLMMEVCLWYAGLM
jgi:hypothetical protein